MKKLMPGVLLTMGLLLAAALTPAALVSAQGVTMPDKEITIDGKKPARFNHENHLKLGINCGQCHHDAEHQPYTEATITAMSSGEQLRCISCHNEKFSNAKLIKPKQIFHARCRDCHKKGVADKKGPGKCSSCHIKK